MGDEERDDLRATAESIVASAEELKKVELRKLELEPEHSETHKLAEKAKDLSEDIANKAEAEKELVEQITADAEPEARQPA